jgi:hypothetical protein
VRNSPALRHSPFQKHLPPFRELPPVCSCGKVSLSSRKLLACWTAQTRHNSNCTGIRSFILIRYLNFFRSLVKKCQIFCASVYFLCKLCSRLSCVVAMYRDRFTRVTILRVTSRSLHIHTGTLLHNEPYFSENRTNICSRVFPTGFRP